MSTLRHGLLLEDTGTPGQISQTFISSKTVVNAPTFLIADFIASTAVHAPSVSYTGQQTTVTTPGTYTWICPPGVTHIYVEAFGGGAGSNTDTQNCGHAGGGGGAFSAREAVPVTPGTVYTFVVGAGGGIGVAGGDSTFTGDSSTQVVAKGGSPPTTGGDVFGRQVVGGVGGQASSSTGDSGHVFSGGSGGAGDLDGGVGGAGGGASGNQLSVGAAGTDAAFNVSPGNAGGTGANGGGSGGDGGDAHVANANPGSSPGGGAGGGSSLEPGASGAAGRVYITTGVLAPFIASNTAVYTPTVPITPPFIGSTTTVYSPSLPLQLAAPFISSATVVYTPAVPEIHVPFIGSNTRVYGAWSLFRPDATYSGPGNGGETFLIRLAANGATSTATLAAGIGLGDTTLSLTGDSGLPPTIPFMLEIDDEIIYVSRIGPGSYRIRGRGMSNTVAATHTTGATATWSDSYDMAIVANSDILASFTADINSSGSTTYPGWLICFDSSQAYLTGARYPTHVAEVLGVFPAGTGSSGSNRCDAAQPNAICTPVGVSDACPAGLANPARISSNVTTGDVAMVRYTNTEATELDLGARAASLQSWFGLKRVDSADTDVTFTDPTGIVVDTIPSGSGPGPFTGSVHDDWYPAPEEIGIAPDASDAAGFAIDTPSDVPWTTVTLPGSDRYFTDGTDGSEKGWPICCLAVRQGNRRVPRWQSWDWKDYASVYTGFGTDETFAQLLINRNGVNIGLPEVALPGPQDIDGPNAVWDDDSYYFAASWYVAILGTPYLVSGPTIGGEPTGGGVPTEPGYTPVVSFPTPGSPTISTPPQVEGGTGGDIVGVGGGMHVWGTS